MVFGGVVLREAYDSAFSAVYLFSGEVIIKEKGIDFCKNMPEIMRILMSLF